MCGQAHGPDSAYDLICGFDYSTTQLPKATSLHQSGIFDPFAAACSPAESLAGAKREPEPD